MIKKHKKTSKDKKTQENIKW